MSKPLIGITGRRWPLKRVKDYMPRATWESTFDLHMSDYPRSVAAAGGIPVQLTRDAAAEDVLDHLDGLILSGGADIDPDLYGAEPHPRLGRLEKDRDTWEMALLAGARRRHLPILAICRGFQLVNVSCGGSLVQHVEEDEGSGHPRWEADGRTAVHDVHVVPGTMTSSLLAPLTGVNSLHHQTVDRVGEGLVVSAVAPDGVVEGLESSDGEILAVQWHPELLGGPDPTFRWIVAESTKYAEARTVR